MIQCFCCSIETYLQTIDAKLAKYQEKYPGIFQVINRKITKAIKYKINIAILIFINFINNKIIYYNK